MPNESYLGISALAAQYDISLRTLRLYEERGFLSPVRIGGARYYTFHDRVRLELVLKGKRLGFSLDEIWRLIFDKKVNACIDTVPAIDRNELMKKLKALTDQKHAVELAMKELADALASKL